MIPRFNYTFSSKCYINLLFETITSNDSRSAIKAEYFYYNYARTALRVLLSSVSRASLKVGVQAYTCHTVFEAIKRAGHEIIYIDLDNELKLSIDDLAAKIKDIDILIVTHTFGFPENFDLIKAVAKNIIIIEDCSHSYGSKYRGQYTGTLGDAAIFSSGLGKIPPVGSGGFAYINNFSSFPFLEIEDEKLSKKSKFSEVVAILKLLIYSITTNKYFYGLTYFLFKKLDSKVDLIKKLDFSESKGFHFSRILINEHCAEIQYILHCNTVNYKNLNSQIKNFLTPNNYTQANFNMFPLLHNDRDHLYSLLLMNGIEPGKQFSSSIDWAKNYGYTQGSCKNTESIVNRILTIPIHKDVSKENISVIINTLQLQK